MTEVIVFPDLPEALSKWLQFRLAARGEAARVETRVPSPRPARLVVVSQVGGARLNIALQQVRMLVECWDASQARRLANICSAEIEAATRSQDPIWPGVWITADPEDFSVPVLFPDPTSTSPRVQFNANLTLRGSAI